MLRLNPRTVFTNDVVQPPYFPVDNNKATKKSFPLILPSFSPIRRETPGGNLLVRMFSNGKKQTKNNNNNKTNKGALSRTRCLNQIDLHRPVKVDSVTSLRNMLFEVRNLRQSRSVRKRVW